MPVLACVERPVELEFHPEEVIVSTCQFIDAIVRPLWGDSGLFCIISFAGCLVFLGLYSQGGLLRSGVRKVYLKRLRWSRGSVLAFGTQVRGGQTRPKPSDFSGRKKILSTPSFGGEVKPSVSCRRFKACKRSLNVTWKSVIFRQNSSWKKKRRCLIPDVLSSVWLPESIVTT